MTWQTEYLLYGSFSWTPLTSFISLATLFLYAVHRIVGLEKVRPFLKKYRYSIIYRFRRHIQVYAVIGGVGAFYFFWKLSVANQLLLVIPAILSLGYVLPIMRGKKRFRDFNYLKIFLIAIVWSVITVVMPILEHSQKFDFSHLSIVFERMLFIFAITLPFDIRDLQIDAHIDVKTIPTTIGITKTKWLAYGCLWMSFLLAIFAVINEWYPQKAILGFGISVVLTALLIERCDRTDKDYFFTGLMDGTMILQAVLVWISTV